MRYLPQLLAKAFLAAVKETPDNKQSELIKNFLRVSEKYGGKSYLMKTMKEIERLDRKERGIKQIALHTARPIPKKLLGTITSTFHKNDEVEEKINPELIAGIKIVIDNEFSTDNTLKRKLEVLFT
ncbi:MAG TPA: F0F1 ATP synthase subunit delta [Candidatus Paceibacterota bacterium]